MLFSYFVSERAAREARRRARILAQRKRRAIIRYSVVFFASLLLLIAVSIVFSRTRVYTEPSDEHINLSDNSEHADLFDRQQVSEQPTVVNTAGTQAPAHVSADLAFGEHSSTSQPKNESVQQQAQSDTKLEPATAQIVSTSSLTTSHRLASVSDGYDSLSAPSRSSIQDSDPSEKAPPSQLSTGQQPLDTIGDEEGGNGIVIKLDKKEPHSDAGRKEDLPQTSQATDRSETELKTALKVSSDDGGNLNSHTDSREPDNSSLSRTSHSLPTDRIEKEANEVRQETHRITNPISPQ